jgi:DNA-binding IscR family transcriptional regulator
LSERLQQFIRATIRSAWALELLLLMSRERGQARSAEAINRELRGSLGLVLDILATFRQAGLVVEEAGGYRYAPASAELESLVQELEAEYAARPLAVFKAVAAAPNDKIQTFADAFKVKKD